MTPPDTVGYCAVVSPQTDFWQGYFIRDNHSIRQGAQQMQMMAMMMASHANPYGSLQAVLAEGALAGNSAAIASAALALRGSDTPYFYVLAQVEPNGTTTSLHQIDAASVEEARAKIEAAPEVVAIKKRLTERMGLRDGMGRRSAL